METNKKTPSTVAKGLMAESRNNYRNLHYMDYSSQNKDHCIEYFYCEKESKRIVKEIINNLTFFGRLIKLNFWNEVLKEIDKEMEEIKFEVFDYYNNRHNDRTK